MIVGVHGTLETTGPDWVHLRVGGVTLQISVPANAVSWLGANWTKLLAAVGLGV